MRKLSAISVLFVMTAVYGFTTEVLPQDESTTTGHLENGLQYYVKKNGFPKERISLQLVVKAGSIHEEEYQRGLAHFLEHMVFRGSENFEDWEVIKYLESIGAKLGPDANAYTTQDCTVYQLDIPADKEEIVEKGFQILSDFAGKAKLDNVLIDLEREVVMDEYFRNKRNAQGRIMEKMFDVVFGDSLYAKRHPIGLEEVIRGCNPSAIKEFYQKWYRPDRMALIVVGDADQGKLEGYIKKYFCPLVSKGEMPIEPNKKIEKGNKRVFGLIEEAETMGHQGCMVSIKEKTHKETMTQEDVKEDECEAVFNATLNHRLSNLSKKYPAPFMGAAGMEFDMTLYHRLNWLFYIGFEDRLTDGLKALISEIEMLKKFGPTEEELKRALSTQKEALKSARANLERKEHREFAGECINHFLRGEPSYLIEKYWDVREGYLNSITITDVIDWASKNIDISKHDLVIVAPNSVGIDKKEMLTAFEELLQKEMTQEEKKGEVAQFTVNLGQNKPNQYVIEKNEAASFKTFTLSNGLKVVVQKSDLEKEEVQFKLVAKGGQTLFPDNYHSSIAFATTYLMNSGFANMDGIQFAEFMTALNLRCAISLDVNHRVGAISGRSERIEDMFKWVRALFTEKRFDEKAWKNILDQVKEVEKTMDNNPEQYFFSKGLDALHSYHPFFAYPKSSEASALQCKEILHRAFSDPSEFTLVIVGDFEEESLEKEIATYLNFTVVDAKKTDLKNIPIGTFPKEAMEKIHYAGKDTHCYNVLALGGEFTFPDKKECGLTTAAFSNAFNFRLLERLRKELGETYGTYSAVAFPFSPDNGEYLFYIMFTCDYPVVERLVLAAEQEIDRFLKEGVTEEEIVGAKAVLLQNYKKSVQYNAFLVDAHTSEVIFDVPYERCIDFEGRLETQVTKEKIDLIAKALFENRPLVKMRLLPESMKK
jgi:zinc protease